jgi:hypothetical protein
MASERPLGEAPFSSFMAAQRLRSNCDLDGIQHTGNVVAAGMLGLNGWSDPFTSTGQHSEKS